MRAVIAANDPADVAALFARMFGAAAIQCNSDQPSLSVGLSRFDIVTPARLAAEFGNAAPSGGGRSAFMAALTLRTRSLAQAAACLAKEGIPAETGAGRLLAPHDAAFGVAIEFRE